MLPQHTQKGTRMSVPQVTLTFPSPNFLELDFAILRYSFEHLSICTFHCWYAWALCAEDWTLMASNILMVPMCPEISHALH